MKTIWTIGLFGLCLLVSEMTCNDEDPTDDLNRQGMDKMDVMNAEFFMSQMDKRNEELNTRNKRSEELNTRDKRSDELNTRDKRSDELNTRDKRSDELNTELLKVHRDKRSDDEVEFMRRRGRKRKGGRRGRGRG